jgi:hypothetical protein
MRMSEMPTTVRAEGCMSLLLERLEHAGDQGAVSIDSILLQLGDRSYGVILLLLAMPNLIPVPLVPGSTTLTGVPMMLIGAQLVRGLPNPSLPKMLLRQTIPANSLHTWVGRVKAVFARIEPCIHPRWQLFTTRPVSRWVGGLVFCLSGILALPIPFGNFLPAVAITLIGLGFLEKDGGCVLLGVVMGLVTAGVLGALAFLARLWI